MRYAGTLASVLLLLSACGRGTAPPQETVIEEAVPVVAQAAQRGTLRAVIHASGLVTPSEGAEFLAVAPEPARIDDILHAEGDMVASGDVLVRFALPLAIQNLSRQTADVQQATARLENARIAQSRTRDLVERGLVARRDQETPDREVAEAQSSLAIAQAQLQQAEIAAAAAVVRAPFAGVVAGRLKEPGDLAVPGTSDAVIRLVDPLRLEVTASIPVEEIPRIVVGATARLAGVGEMPVRLRVAAVSRPGPGSLSGDAPVHLVFLDQATLSVDTPVQVDIDAEERSDVVFVGPEAVVGSGREAVVYVVAGDRAERRSVTLGLAEEERVEITEGLRAGELVITRGQTNLPDGALINVQLAAQ